MFHVTLLIRAYVKTVSYYFCVFRHLKYWKLENYFFYFVKFFWFLKIFILCASLSLNFKSRKNASWKDCLHEKSQRKNAYSIFCISVIPSIES